MKHLKGIFVIVAALITLTLGFTGCGSDGGTTPAVVEIIDTPPPPPPPHMEYGFYVDSFDLVVEDSIKSNQVLSDILLPYGVGWGQMTSLQEETDSIFNLSRDFRPGRRYMLFCNGDSSVCARYMVYQINAIDYMVFDFGDSVQAHKASLPVDLRLTESTGYIKQGSSLWLTLNRSIENKDVVNSLVDEISDAYAWTIDFFNIKAGDTYKIIYEEMYVEDRLVARGSVKALYFNHNGSEFYGVKFTQDGSESYFDEKGKGLRKAFLKAPLKYSRISSGYSKRRFHPVQKRYKSHLGTDYAAPKGTPIWSVGEGTVIKKGYTKGNGNFVKVKHNETYTTQYLHMSKFANIKKGQHVKQGEVIGYVGSTGLATGPHVCFRFWKNGKQIDHRQEKFQTSEPIKEANKEAFEKVLTDYKAQLDSIIVEVPEPEL